MMGTSTICWRKGKRYSLIVATASLGLGLAYLAPPAYASASEPARTEQQAGKVKITGMVVDAQGEALSGATILEVGTSNGIMTDLDGKFTLNVQPGASLQISFVGFQTQTIKLSSGQRTLNIKLKDDSETLSELVVVGYGVVKKADLAGAVSVMDSKAFKDQPVTKLSDALQGRVSGVQVEQSGVPGGNVRIRVRGANSISKSNEPLYIVDGVVRESGLAGINTEDIQSMQVLKDASSTAIYGARGSNGVVMVTTKRGKSGVTQVIFDANFGIANLAKKLPIVDPVTYLQHNQNSPYATAHLADYKSGKLKGIDWQDEIFRTGITQNYKLAFSKGNQDTQYYLSGSYVDLKGTIENTLSKRYQGKLNINSQFNSWLGITADVDASRTETRGNGFFGAGMGNVVLSSLLYSPAMDMFNTEGQYARDPINSLNVNPLGALRHTAGESQTTNVNARFDLRLNLAKGLSFTSTNGMDYAETRGFSFASALVEGLPTAMGNSSLARTTLQSSNNLTYMGQWDKHSLTATGVFEMTKSNTHSISINGKELSFPDLVRWYNISMAKTREASNDFINWALLSYVGRIIYNYDNRYLLTATMRADGSSRFVGDKWGYFPSLALAWSLSNEQFMKNFDAVQDIKLRASYGLVGNQAIDPYATLGLMLSNASTNYGFGQDNNYTGYWAANTILPKLTWEKTAQLDLGLEFSLFKRRLTVGIDYFYKRTSDALMLQTRADYLGGTKEWINAGEISNRGIDLTLSARILEGKDWSWNSTLNASYVKNRVENLAGKDYIEGWNPASNIFNAGAPTYIKVGEAIGSFWGYEWTGLDAQGIDTYRDINGDGKLDVNDRVTLGKASPDFTFGWNNTISYKNWDLNFFFNASLGAKRLNVARYMMANAVGQTRAIVLEDAYSNGFDAVGQGAEHPTMKPVTGRTPDMRPNSSKWLENADYLRLENLSLSYNLSRKVTKFADLRLTLSAQNLFTITGYKGFDPSGSSFNSGSSEGGNADANAGIDMGSYPTPRSFTLGVRLTF